MSEFVQVSTTADNPETAACLARSSVGARLAAGGQVFGPVRSFFWHLGEQGEAQEWQVILKTTADRYDALEAHLLKEHPWSNPEITAIPLVAAPAEYLKWIRETVSVD